ncbi:unnamed protein product [Caenorhabditis angaria]|uniref:MSP domain-containing protein n=1 Tax=Caenorhabditis angaria TaxID=860376 RepID=A0A9P1IAE4_9PELO|nr:unnamed protein product [Caenorhabditis angaria]
MSLKFTVSEIKWKAPEGQSVLKIINETKFRFAYKILCTNNEIYSTSPNEGFLGSGFTQNLVVVRKKGDMKDDKLAVQYVETDDTVVKVETAFKKEGVIPNLFLINMKCTM